MKAIIVAAGVGSRLGDLTKELPKPLIDVNGKSIIERQLSILKQNEILDVIIITGPHNEKFNSINFFAKLKFPQWFAEISAIKKGIFLIIIIQSCYILKLESRLSFKKVFTVFRVKF